MPTMSRWTPKQFAHAAPDAASLTAARRLARPGPWTETGSNETLLWGKCQGSGKTPYQVSVDLVRPAYRCSCPSRKFPCKHALALLLLWSQSDGAIADVAEAAGFASEWAVQARATAEKRASGRKPPDPAAQAKRIEDRLARMSSGIEEFELWLSDLVRTGAAAARHQRYSWWDTTAGRLVDAQLPGLAEMVRTMGSEIHRRDDWAGHLLEMVGLWWTATRAWRRRDTLDAATQGDLRAFLGWSWATDDVRAAGTTTGTWHVLGAHRTDDGRLQQQRTWVWAPETGETAQLLDFAARGAALPVGQLAGTQLTAEVAFYPGHDPRRLIFASSPQAIAWTDRLPPGATLDAALDLRAAALAENPCVRRIPVVVADARLTPTHVVDASGIGLPLTADTDPWLGLAVTGSHPTVVFGEIEDQSFRPLTVAVGGDRLVSL